MFWFHHSGLDCLWWIWQMKDPEGRVDLIPHAMCCSCMCVCFEGDVLLPNNLGITLSLTLASKSHSVVSRL